jgi:hypothetical protein
MAFKTGGDGNGAAPTTGAKLEPYFKRLSPVAELVYPGAEVRVFDDRAATGQVKVQFSQISERGRKVAVFTFEGTDGLGELVAELSQVQTGLALVP